MNIEDEAPHVSFNSIDSEYDDEQVKAYDFFEKLLKEFNNGSDVRKPIKLLINKDYELQSYLMWFARSHGIAAELTNKKTQLI